jgi:hypothetical protein
VRFADLRSVTRSLTLPAPVSAARALAEIAEEPGVIVSFDDMSGADAHQFAVFHAVRALCGNGP